MIENLFLKIQKMVDCEIQIADGWFILRYIHGFIQYEDIP